MAVAPLIIAGIGTGISAIAQWKAGKTAAKADVRAGEAAQRAAESQAALLDFNAHVSDLQAQDAIDRGAEEESRFRTGVRTLLGSQRAGLGASNTDVAYGSAVDVQADAAYLGELDALTLRTNAAREAWGFQVEATDLRARADITRKEGAQAAETGRITAQTATSTAKAQAIGGIVTGAGSLLAQRYGFGPRK